MCDDEVVSEATVEKVLETIDKQLAVKALCQSLIEPSCSFVQSIRKLERILKLFKFSGKIFQNFRLGFAPRSESFAIEPSVQVCSISSLSGLTSCRHLSQNDT